MSRERLEQARAARWPCTASAIKARVQEYLRGDLALPSRTVLPPSREAALFRGEWVLTVEGLCLHLRFAARWDAALARHVPYQASLYVQDATAPGGIRLWCVVEPC